ncbi:hypothetical protein NKH18_00645 [Streptomyces sp. M10(2022)]
MTTAGPGTDRLLVADLVGLLGDAEHYSSPAPRPAAGWTIWSGGPRCCTGSSTSSATSPPLPRPGRRGPRQGRTRRSRGPGAGVRRPAARTAPPAVNAQAPRKS